MCSLDTHRPTAFPQVCTVRLPRNQKSGPSTRRPSLPYRYLAHHLPIHACVSRVDQVSTRIQYLPVPYGTDTHHHLLALLGRWRWYAQYGSTCWTSQEVLPVNGTVPYKLALPKPELGSTLAQIVPYDRILLRRERETAERIFLETTCSSTTRRQRDCRDAAEIFSTNYSLQCAA